MKRPTSDDRSTADRFMPVTADYIIYKLAKSFWWQLFRKKLLVMTFKHDSLSIVAIITALQCINVNKSFVSRTMARYRDTGSVARCQGSGRKKTATAKMARKVKKQLDRNPHRSGRKIA